MESDKTRGVRSSSAEVSAAAYGASVPFIVSVLDDVGGTQGVVKNGGYTDDSRPTFTGKAESGAVVYIYDKLKLMGSVVVGGSGDWSFTPVKALVDGKYEISVVYQYANGDFSDMSAPHVITVDKVPPEIVTVTGVMDDQGRITGAVSDKGVTDDNQPTVVGTAEPHARVVVFNKEIEIGRVTADGEGNWSFTPDAPLADGLYLLKFITLDGAGNQSDWSKQFQFVVDTRPARINFFGAEDNAGNNIGTVFSGGATDDTTPTLWGSATAGGLVSIYESGVLLGQTTAGVDGFWEFTPAIDLSKDVYKFYATVSFDFKGESAPSSPFTLTVKNDAPNARSVERVQGDEGSEHVLALAGGEQKFAIAELSEALVQVESASAQGYSGADAPVYAVPIIGTVLDNTGSIQGFVANGGITDDSLPTFSGKADGVARVHFYNNSELMGNVPVGDNGEWLFTPVWPLADGRREISVIYEYKDGEVSDVSEPYVIFIDRVAPDTPIVNAVLDDQGRITGAISHEGVTDDNRPTVTGTAEPNTTLVVYDKGKEVGRVPVDGKGVWNFTPDVPLKDGAYRLEFVAVDRAGNASRESVPFEFQVDTRAERVRILGAEDNAGNDIGTVYSGGATDDATPTLWGSATVGGLVSIYESGMLLGQTTVDVDGSWEFTPDVALGKDVYKFYATVSFDFKGESAPSPSFTLTVNNDAPNARSIERAQGDDGGEHGQALAGFANTASYAEASAAALAFSPPAIDSVFDGRGSIQGIVENGGITDDARAILRGRGDGVYKVHCYKNGASMGTALVGDNGEWSFTPRSPFVDGRYELSVIYQYENGSVSGISDSYVIFVDNLAPAVPLVIDVMDDQGRITGAISNGGVTDDNRPTVVGTTEPNATLIVYDMENEIGRVQADGAGKWSFTPDAPLKDGMHRLDFVAVDRVGNGSENSGLFEFQVDTRAERIRILGADDNVGNDIGSLYSGSATDDATPTLWGTATVGGLVSIYESGVLLGQTTAEVDGFWEFTPDVALSKDVYKFYATVSFDFKGESAPSSPFTLTIKDDARSARSIEHVQGDEAGEHALVLAGDEQKFAVAELSQILVQVENELFASEVPLSGAADTAASDVGAYHAQSVNADMLRLHDFALEAY